MKSTIPRSHPIWDELEKINDAGLTLLCVRVLDDYYEKFYTMPMAGFSKDTNGLTGWQIIEKILSKVKVIRSVLGNNTCDYDILTVMCLVSLCGMGDFLSRENEPGYEFMISVDIYRSPFWTAYRESYYKYINDLMDYLFIPIDKKHDIISAICLHGNKLTIDDSAHLSRAALTFLECYALTIRGI